MRIVLDLQGAQSLSRHRGIGRYTRAMAHAFASAAAGHDVWLMLNGQEDESSERLIQQFADVVPRERMVIDEIPSGVAGCNPANGLRAHTAEIAQAGLFARLQPDCVWHSSLFEGWFEDAVATLGAGDNDDRHVATLYDLIPLQHPERHLHHPRYRRWYYQRVALLKRCGLLLAISESSRRDAMERLRVCADKISVVHGAADPLFVPTPAGPERKARWRCEWGLDEHFVLYVGGYDPHKNVETLVAAYAALDPQLRSRFPLVLAGSCDALARQRLETQLRRHRLDRRQVVFTGRLDDAALIALYSSCSLFVTPSLHEGLGLPALEAMSCGAAVIGSSISSLPEIIGRRDSLFDPRSRSDMAAHMHRALADVQFNNVLRQHALKQAARFTWTVSARRALDAIEQHMCPRTPTVHRPYRPRLAYISPLPPAHTGIADYSAELVRELGDHYDVDVVVDQEEVLDPWIQANCSIRSWSWFTQNIDPDTRVLYHFGNSPFHARMLGMLARYPGVAVMHDTWLSGLHNWLSKQSDDPGDFLRILYRNHGYRALQYASSHEGEEIVNAYPMSFDVIDRAPGLIVHSRHARDLVNAFYGPGVQEKLHVVPFPRAQTHADRRSARQVLGLPESDFVVCCFGMLASTKLDHRLLEAWLASGLNTDAECRLVFVGQNHGGAYGRDLERVIAERHAPSTIEITGHVGRATYDDYLASADLAVQLRCSTRGETSAAVFDALANGLPVIVNSHGSLAELPDQAVFKLPDIFETVDLVHALQFLRHDEAARAALAARGREMLATRHHPARVALQYRDVVERAFAQSPRWQTLHLLSRLQRRMPQARGIAPEAVQVNCAHSGKSRLFIDVTATAANGLHTGIERVVHAVSLQMLNGAYDTFRVEPVRLQTRQYVHAHDYTFQLLGQRPIGLDDGPVQPRAGDIFLGLDWVADALTANESLLRAWQVRGVRMFFVVYDLLPVRIPERFPHGIPQLQANWLRCIAEHADGLICISRTVADDLRAWYAAHPPRRTTDLPIGYFYPGSDFQAAVPTQGMPADADTLLATLRQKPAFLMLGTVEPRKGHAFVLDAFEQLWARGISAVLVMVGRTGWVSERLLQRIREHGQWGRQLIWLEHVSDEYLEHLFASVRGLIAASEGEGYGLPLVEAARHGVPVLARDIPVFREIAGEFASFFSGHDPQSLARTIEARLQPTGPRCERESQVAWVGWQETTAILRAMLIDTAHPHWLAPWRMHAAGARGRVEGREMTPSVGASLSGSADQELRNTGNA